MNRVLTYHDVFLPNHRLRSELEQERVLLEAARSWAGKYTGISLPKRGLL